MSATLDSRCGLVAETTPFSAVDGPGNRFVVFLQGCNFDCIACHNPQTIPGHEPVDGHGPQRLGVGDLLVGIRRAAPFISGITASGGEATQQPDFVHDLFAAVKSDEQLADLTCMVDSNGACDRATWDLLAPVMDGAMIDLKSLDPAIHERLTGQPNDRVLDSIRYLGSLERLYEVRLLLVGGINDDPMVLRRTAEWLAAIDPTMRVKIIGFRHHGVRPHVPPLIDPLPEDLGAAASLLRDIAPFDVAVI
jgi:pyruvate-formate lyase-activating enzyme